MAYITSNDFTTYLSTYGGTDVSGDNFDVLVNQASIDIDTATFNRIEDITKLQTHQQTMIKNATCSHAQTLSDYGDGGSLVSDGRRISLGDLSVDSSNSDIFSRMSNRTKDWLSKSGLSNKTIDFVARRGYWR